MEPTYVPSPLRLPRRRLGKLSIQHRTYRDEVWIVSPREAILTGRSPLRLKIQGRGGLRVHELHDKDHGMWMSDHPCELWQMAEAVERLNGNVLMGGLGLGLAARMAADRPEVKSVMVIERSADVIELAAGGGWPAKVTVVEGDVYAFLRACELWHWDSAFFDTWQGTNEMTWFHEVAPLKRLIGQFGYASLDSSVFWAENMMRGQLAGPLGGSLLSRLLLKPEVSDHSPAGYRAWRHGMEDLFPDGGERPWEDIASWHMKIEAVRKDPAVQARLVLFLDHVGMPEWERQFGRFWPETAVEVA